MNERDIPKALKDAAHACFAERQREALLSNEDLDKLWDLLCDRSSEGKDDERKITYVDFCTIKKSLPDKFSPFFKASTYLKFVSDDKGLISVLQFFNYVLRKARLDLSFYDDDNDGYLTEEELQQYIADLIPSLHLEAVNKSFHKFYVCTAARKFFFFLDPLRRGRISIHSILLSPILTELFELREPELPKEFERSNWFSSYSTLRVYGQFLNLDVDHNGMLSRKEMSKYNNGTLTDIFLDRLFQEYQTYRGEMDYKGFLDLVLATENTQTPESIRYGFKLLDIKGEGCLDDFSIRYLFKAVIDKMVLFGHEPVGVEDVTNEIFDMANPKDPRFIGLDAIVEDFGRVRI
ncbi:Serine/threonine-protein phosphatase 2A regulatory subunit B'' subunit gamma [Dinochytrium kinnereticum]|nr:Serine/threonine-protein phosphatase 2A regulatory subunit B'' subunit gamma [Dinochytrium kinnereticum]